MSIATEVVELGELLASLQARGLWIQWTAPDSLEVGPPEKVGVETLEALRRWKPVLLDAFANPRTWPCVRCGRHLFKLPCVCYWCRKSEERPGHA